MVTEEEKQIVSKHTGIPVNLLSGETQEELLAQARALLKYREELQKEPATEKPKTPGEQFAEWFNEKCKPFNPFE